MRHSSVPPLSFFDPCGRGSRASALILGRMRAAMSSGNRKNSFSALDFSATRYSGTQLASLDELRLDLFDRDARFVPTRFRDQDILDLLPEFGVLTKVD